MVRAEQENAQHPVQELPKGEVVFSKELTLEELLGFTKYETYRIGLDNVPFAFEVRDLGDSLLNIVSFSEEQPLDSRNFVNLLNAAKSGGNSRMGQSLFAITSDWDIILPEVRARDTRKQKLYDHHKENVPHFSEFEANHFKKFWHTIAPSAESIDIIFNKQASRFISEEGLILWFGKEFFTSDIRNVIRMATWYKYRALTIEFLKNKRYDLSEIKAFYEEPTSLFSRFDELTRKELQGEWYDYLVSRIGERKIAIDAHRDIYRHFHEEELIVVGRNGNLYDTLWSEFNSGPRIALHGVDSIEKLGSGQVKVSKGESYIIIDFVADEKGIRRSVIKEKQYSPYSPNPAAFLAPLIIWQRDKKTNQASYFCGQIPQELIKSHSHLFSERHDTLLGQLVVAAYSPEVRDQMPKEIKMKGTNGKEVTQQMLEAQTVLLVPRFANKFLEQSPVILGLEALAKH